MAHALSFTDDFLLHDDAEAIRPSERPVSVYQAILGLQRDTWREIARDLFDLSADRLTSDMILARVIDTNTCANLDEPVEVWIDPNGEYFLNVYSLNASTPSVRPVSSS